MSRETWAVPPDWVGETAFILGGGPSVATLDLSGLTGRRVIAINSSCYRLPAADYVVFADDQWWRANRSRLTPFKGRIVAASRAARDDATIRLKRLRRSKPAAGLPAARDTVPVERTSTAAAIGLAVHLGVSRIVLIGIDQCRGPNGESDHYGDSPPTKNKPGNRSWDSQMPELRQVGAAVAARGIEVVNCSLVSRIDWWPKRPLAEVLAELGPPPARPRKEEGMGTLESREFDALKRRRFRDYSVGHQRMYLFPIEKMKGRRWSIFEAGFGIGFGLGKMLAANVVESYRGCEPNRDSFNYTFGLYGTRPEVSLICERFSHELIPHPPADHTFCIEVIEHLPPEQHAPFLGWLRSCGPRLWLSTPDITRHPREGVRTTEEWEAMLRAAGFGKVEVDRSQWTHLFACE